MIARTPNMVVTGIRRKTQSKISKDVQVGDIVRLEVPIQPQGRSRRGAYATTLQFVNETQQTSCNITMNDANTYVLNIFDLKEV